ncbi:MAG: Lysine-oxoglutarate reductase/Saccharopine dehydrogenase family enzyme [Candidatus Methanohalarchaeum thermophilum]|uniref:Ornithine cyclodeaminase n=1 Tax=Methanohalarchaeum thermophilum TaxID=1903181 RepID=A0A1Q6DUX0_METT1|nr:MAG: Lysine-oxoglutarate reductase/Saccharopine dehydrogenase family enzyme [Candidatus Methanohalarchaeum thermophilum]
MSIREVELEGHIIDSRVLPKVFDLIMDMDGDFEVLDFEIGKEKEDESYAKIQIRGRNQGHVDDIVSELHRHGANLPEIEEVEYERAPADKSLPRGFYSTTNHQTYIRYNNEWVEVERIEMDCAIIIDENKAICKPISEVKEGEKIVVGEKGVRVVPPERPREKSVFEFMSSHVSPEKPSNSIIDQVANEIIKTKKSGGKIAFVLGPAIIHTGGSKHMASLIKNGFADVLLAGNAVAVHDIENALYGTSLGVNLETGEPQAEGHKNHLYAISEIMRSSSIENAIEQGKIEKGIMYQCEKKDIEYVLAGSIRDDGPLPEVITDTVKAQDKMREAIQDVDLVVMMATMLHSIATGNLLPSHVKTICVDINPDTVTKLTDRGTEQVMGIVSDVGIFLPKLTEKVLKNS